MSEQTLHKCPECSLHYTQKEVSEKCEMWCKENKSCNLTITKFAVGNNKNPNLKAGDLPVAYNEQAREI